MTRAIALALGMVLVATSAFAEEGIQQKLQGTREALDTAKDERSRTQAAVQDAQEVLAAANRQLADVESRLVAEEAALAAATAALQDAQAATLVVAQQLDEVGARLEATRQELADKKGEFNARAVAAYKYGGSVSYAGALLDADDFSELATTAYYLKSVMQYDNRLIEQVSGEAREIAEARADVDLLHEQLTTQQAEAERAAVEVERATQAQRKLAEMAAIERAKSAEIKSQLDGQLASYNALVADLEAESRKLEEELARSRWRAGRPGVGELLWPTNGRAGSGFGWRVHPIYGSRRMHTGVDISGPYGQPIIAAAEGLVVHAGWRGGYGLAVVIDHGGGLATLYAHQSSINVASGQVVSSGQKIGSIGSTGQSTGPHLHFEVRVNGTPKDPMQWY
jgi:murein DD-endopeptidase MepM/ murein hydrolase activator NlpD